MSKMSEEPRAPSAGNVPPANVVDQASEHALTLGDSPAHYAVLEAAVDTLAYPMLALQADALILHANLAARELLGQDRMLVVTAEGYLAPKSAARRAEFQAALHGAAGGQPQQLSWAEGALTLYATLRPLGEPMASAPTPPVLMMLAPLPETLFDASGFAATYGLSAAERRVLEALLHGHQAQEAADRLGVGVATVRSQIAAIRKKTGHDSVASLLAALGDLPPLRRA